jgi:drug/metabolite transporter (DMT)-like permease
MIHVFALVGVLVISFSAIFVRLAAVSPVTATFYRAAYALPVLAAIWLALRQSDRRDRRERWLAVLSGLILAVDLALWHESIALVGAGLGTVIANVQVVFVAIAAWLMFGERLTPGRVAMIIAILGGVALTSGLARHDAYGTNPVAGVIIGLFASVCYSAFILVYRQANRTPGPASGPLLDSTAGMLAGALACALFDRQFSFGASRTAHAWLAMLAIGSQVVGWLLIGQALPSLPAVEMSILLLVQPIFTVLWGVALFEEHLSMLQWLGCAIVLGGVATLSIQRAARAPDHASV